MRLFHLLLYFLLPTSSHSGCYQRRMCCSGRNNTCKAVDNGLADLPMTQNQYHTPHYELVHHDDDESEDEEEEEDENNYNLVFPDVFDDDSDEKIGKLILPDIIETDERVYEKYGLPVEDPGSDSDQNIKDLVFGKEKDEEKTPEEHVEYQEGKPRHLLIRYSVLSKYMPLRITTRRTPRRSRVPPLTMYPVGEQECYCDEHCVTLDDCCSDYPTVCPRTDCEVGDFHPWTQCLPDNGTCGIGTQERLRDILVPAERGGTPCPPLKEMKTCFVDCTLKRKSKMAIDDITTVALILNYKYNKTRATSKRNNVYWDLPNIAEKVKKASYYCVHYTINWVNRNCVSVLLNKGLTENSVMCAECQPEATYHRKNGRCASDLDDGDQGFWKLIGPKSCNGIWTRINRTDHCRCQEQYPDDYPFLLV